MSRAETPGWAHPLSQLHPTQIHGDALTQLNPEPWVCSAEDAATSQSRSPGSPAAWPRSSAPGCQPGSGFPSGADGGGERGGRNRRSSGQPYGCAGAGSAAALRWPLCTPAAGTTRETWGVGSPKPGWDATLWKQGLGFVFCKMQPLGKGGPWEGLCNPLGALTTKPPGRALNHSKVCMEA